MSGDIYTLHAAHLCANVLAGEMEAERPLIGAALSCDPLLREAVSLASAAVVLSTPGSSHDGDSLFLAARKLGREVERLRASGDADGPAATEETLIEQARTGTAGAKGKLLARIAFSDSHPLDALLGFILSRMAQPSDLPAGAGSPKARKATTLSGLRQGRLRAAVCEGE